MDEESNKRLAQLIAQLAQGNASALEEIAHLMERILKSIGNMYYKNQADVEDAVENVYIKLYDKASAFKKNTNACAWIIRVFENQIKSNLRTKKREASYVQSEIAYLQSDASKADERYVDNYLFLQETLGKLTEEERELFLYYHWGKCSLREIAQIVHRPKSTVHNKLKALEEKIKNL